MTKHSPKVTIGIPFLNSWKDLDRCISSVEKSLNNTNITYEIIVVNDGSTDTTPLNVSQKYPHIMLLHNKTNKGISVSMNKIITQMKGKYLLRLDADTIVTTNAIQGMLEYLDIHEDVGIVGPRMVSLSGTFQLSYDTHRKKAFSWVFDYALWYKKLWQKIVSPKDILTVTKDPLEVTVVIGAAICTRKKAIEDVGGFDRNLLVFMDDSDWCYRIKEHGWNVYYLPYLSLIHKGGSAWGGQYIHTKNSSLKNVHYFYKKHSPGFATQLVLTGAILLGTSISIITALFALPLSVWFATYRTITFRSLYSFSHVYLWYIKCLLQLL